MPTTTTAETLCGPRPAPHTMAFLRWCDEYISRRKRQCTFKRPTIYYVASNGNDSNNGTSPSTPWQTYAKVISHIGANSGGNYSILFRRGDTFRSATGIILTATNVHFGAYGPLTTNSAGVQRPIISHFTVRWIAGGTSWSLVSGNTYSASVPASGTNNPSGATSIGFLRLDYDPLNPLRAQDSPSNCGLDPWSFHVAGSTVYINLEGLNPNDFTIEAVPVNASTPPYGIRIQNGSSGVWIDELRFDGWGAGTQGLTLGDGNQANESGVVNEAGGTAAQAEHVAYISNCESYYNGAHAFSQQPSGIGGTHIVEGCLAGLGYNAPNGETTFNTYAGDGQQEAVFRRCFVRFGLLPQNIGTGNRRVTKGSITTNAGFFGHTAGNVNQPVGIYLNIDCGTMDERSSFDRATACQDYFGFDESSTSIFRTTDNAVPTSIRAFVIGYKSSRVRTETDSPLIGCQRMIFINSSFYMRRAWPIGSSITFAFRSFHSLCINCVFELEDEQGDRCALFQALDNVPSAMTRLLNCLLIFRGHAVNAASEDKFQIHGPNGNDKVRLANTIIISKDRLLNTVSGKQVSLCRASDVSLGGPANSTNTLRNVAIAGCFVASAGSWVGFDAAPGLVNLETANNTYPDPAVFVLGDTEARRMQSGGAYTLDPQSPLAGAGSSNPFSDKSDMLPAPEYDFFGRRRPATPSIGPVDVIDLGSGGFGRSVNRSVVVG